MNVWGGDHDEAEEEKNEEERQSPLLEEQGGYDAGRLPLLLINTGLRSREAGRRVAAVLAGENGERERRTV